MQIVVPDEFLLSIVVVRISSLESSFAPRTNRTALTVPAFRSRSKRRLLRASQAAFHNALPRIYIERPVPQRVHVPANGLAG